jgi:PAS domain S-box-containing protein
MKITDVTPTQYREVGGMMWEKLIALGRMQGEFIMCRRDDTIIETEFRAVADILPGIHMTFIRDITERKQAEEELRMFKTVIEASEEAISISDPDGKLIYINPAHEKLFGRSLEEARNMNYRDYYPPESVEIINTVVAPALARGESWIGELDVADVWGRHFPLWRRAGSVCCDNKGQMLFSFAFMHDISQRRGMENQLKASLAEKEVLLREIHHRVKNNMQVITSLLRLQSRQIKDPQILELFKESQTRISAMALIHETLYQSPELTGIDFHRYLDKLSRTLFQIFGTRIGDVRLFTDAQGVFLNIDQAVPLGLVINELISNALKYAFPDKNNGEIRVVMRRMDETALELCVSDNGVGIPKERDLRNMNSLGLSLVFDLVERQLQGIVKVDRTQGLHFAICFQQNEPTECKGGDHEI